MDVSRFGRAVVPDRHRGRGAFLLQQSTKTWAGPPARIQLQRYAAQREIDARVSVISLIGRGCFVLGGRVVIRAGLAKGRDFAG